VGRAPRPAARNEAIVEGVALRWIPRREPLAAAAVAARGHEATALARRILERDDASLARLRGVAGIEWIVVVGPEAELPWVDGVVVLGVDPRARSLFIPTTLDAELPIGLVERALLLRASSASDAERGAPPLAVLPDGQTIVPLSEARALDRDRVGRWVTSREALR
jgi:hypothetical protein